MSIVLKTPSNGSVTLAEQDTASNVTVTIPATTGNAVISTPDLAYSPYVGFRNRIINGAMTIDQRNAGASSTPTASAYYSCDRWQSVITQTSKFSIQQNAGAITPPVGFTNYLGVTSLSAYSVLTGDTFIVNQLIEGFNVSDLGLGTANAATVTLSFWARSSLTGSFGGSLVNGAANRSYLFSYTVSAANTWEYKTITVSGDTSGTWLTTNGIGMYVRFGLGSGATFSGTAGAWGAGNLVQPTGTVSVVGTSGATFYITGVQLEKGSVATPFEFRSIGQELALCQRYYYRLNGNASAPRAGAGFNATTTLADYVFSFPVQMRIDITALEQSGTASDYNITHGGTNTNCSSVPTYLSGSKDTIGFRFTVASGLTAGQGSLARLLNANAFLGLSAEL
jgi:hypothetical protein